MKHFAGHDVAENRIEEALEFALGILNTISRAPANSSAGTLRALARAGIDLAVGMTDCALSSTHRCRYPNCDLANCGDCDERPALSPAEGKTPPGHETCSACGRLFKWGETCTRGGCPCGGDV